MNDEEALRTLQQMIDDHKLIGAHFVRDTGEAGDVKVAQLFQLASIALQRVGYEIVNQYHDDMPADLSWFEPVKGTNL